MGIDKTRTLTATAGAVVALALGIGIAAGQSDGSSGQAARTLDPTCVEGVTIDPGPGAPPWMRGLLARSEGLDRHYGLGRYAEGGECADVPQWFVALSLRSDAMNRAGGLGAYAPGRP